MLLNSNKGFTLSETMISLTLLMVMLSLSYPLLHSLEGPSYYKELSARQFFIFIQQEVHYAREASVEGNSFQIIDSRHRSITIEQYQNIVRKRVGGKGHESLLSKVKLFTVQQTGSDFLVQVELEGGEAYQKRIHYETVQ
ncbi:competence type IV pilus minor pilin ComGF [Halobacillus mangrovi]|uniref:competence type IV pilus minor pilin ComGF n=1 Tax=Halobacillus mangrovi TaxID=402384 RepID=UPI003D996476